MTADATRRAAVIIVDHDPTGQDGAAQGKERAGVSRWLGASQFSSQVSVPGTRRLAFGAVELDWTPPATTTRSMPAMTEAATF